MLVKTNKDTTAINMCVMYLVYEILAFVVLGVARLCWLCRFDLTSADVNSLFLWNSWRFDAQVLAYIGAPVLLLIIITDLCDIKRLKYRLGAVIRYYYAVILTVMTLIVVGEFFYHDNFTTRYSFVFFDFFNENPMSLLQTMWQDYPLCKIIVGAVCLFIVVLYIGNKLKRTTRTYKTLLLRWRIVISILMLGITFIMMRGSVNTYTLQPEAFIVSTNDALNECVPNALYLIKKAWSERQKSFQLRSTEDLLAENGYRSLIALIRTAYPEFQTPDRVFQNDEDSLIETALFKCMENSNLQGDKKPNVLLVFNESWSTFLNEMDKGSELDLLCSLRPHWNEDLVLRNYQSIRNGTIYSLESTILGIPVSPFFNSIYRETSLKSSIALPFKQNGYDTSFITGLDQTWENIDLGLSHQFFDRVEGKQHIMNTVNGAETSLIGVYDQYLYSYLLKKLSEKHDNPQFIIALTSTNHPPYTFPTNVRLPQLTKLWYDSPMLVDDDELKEKTGKGLQYANQSLGDFMTQIKQSSLADNTIILAFGDHNVRNILRYDESHVKDKYKYSVPLYVYIPKKLQTSDLDKEAIKQNMGSHLDLLPSVAPYCFENGTHYLNLGKDILSNGLEQSYSYNEEQILLSDETKRDSITNMMNARMLLMKIFMQRTISTHKQTHKTTE